MYTVTLDFFNLSNPVYDYILLYTMLYNYDYALHTRNAYTVPYNDIL